MDIVYIECASGASGDMLVGAMIDLGVPIDYLRDNLSFLPIGRDCISCKGVLRGGLKGTKFDVCIEDNHNSATKWSDVERIINASTLKDGIKERGLRIFKGLFAAEASVHGTCYDQTHLHELGAIDCLVDILGYLLAVDYLGIERQFVSPVNVGSGIVKTQHGILPVPAPATAELLKGMPLYATNINAELTTPTGAAIIKHECSAVAHMPQMTVSAIGCGAGQRDFHNTPNVLRVFRGEAPDTVQPEIAVPKIIVIETNIDDMSPQLYEPLMTRLFEAGALDVFLTPIIMKKGRPAIKLTIITPVDIREALTGIVFAETTTIGLRYYGVERQTLERQTTTVATPYGDVRVKTALHEGRVTNVAPEFEDCRALADRHNVAVKDVYAAALQQVNGIGERQVH
ncbi:nickel pincer cofactor biosynthesis protein LarC [Candidatus Magnetobacterium casense]|uniref:Putative nickel insertion protein n=1 Tax=Candidatus Magnetobacterium casense TaxID=1455061 RepID=A0ABS6S3J8_9BACT|nr:nickel pincer cofactor biosynthesis protein LarC [Candidatus Magnetobacterium casensis]MBV6343427.1 nickel pincer cofactor biosynthesis protein LarC [Candidatus Magnetobacterium casensis]